jgi:hypothetical protein
MHNQAEVRPRLISSKQRRNETVRRAIRIIIHSDGNRMKTPKNPQL